MIAIDPGAGGGIVRAGLAFNVVSMPSTDRDIWDAMQIAPGELANTCYLEDLVKYAGRNMPSSSMAVYASNWGMIKGFAIALGRPLILVPPKKWQAVLGLGTATGMSKTEWKNKLKNRAQQTHPQVKVTLATADALCLYNAACTGKLG